MTTNHTPGPYRAEYDEMGGYDCMSAAWRIYSPAGKKLATVDLHDYGAPNGSGTDARRLQIEGEALALADAALFASAPDLLAALEWMLPAYLAAHADACRHSGEPSIQSVAGQQIAAARAAIARARGGV
jgi:hypothetical protein